MSTVSTQWGPVPELERESDVTDAGEERILKIPPGIDSGKESGEVRTIKKCSRVVLVTFLPSTVALH